MGARTTLVDRDETGLQKVADGLDPARTKLVAADLGAKDAPERVVTETVAAFGSVTTLLHIAGVYRRVTAADTTRIDFTDQLTVNVQAPFWLTQAALPHLSGGQVVFCGSTAAYVGSAQGAAYCASKAAVLGMMRALAVELAPQGIRVNAIAPGTTDTPINADWLHGDNYRDVLSKIPDGRIGKPEDIVGAILFLVSDFAHHIHGHSIVIDGGLTIQ